MAEIDRDDAARDLNRMLARRAEQHAYIAEAMEELTARRLTLAIIDHEITHAKIRLARAEGRTAPPRPPSTALADAVDEIERERDARWASRRKRIRIPLI